MPWPLSCRHETVAHQTPQDAAHVLFKFSPHSGIAVLVKLDMDHVGPAADRAVFDVFLTRALREVERRDDLLAAGIARVADVAHLFFCSLNDADLGSSRDDSCQLESRPAEQGPILVFGSLLSAWNQ